MEFGCIKRICCIFLLLLLCSACSKSDCIKLNDDVFDYIHSENLHKCNIVELAEYDIKYSVKDMDSLIENIVANSKFEINEEQVADYAVDIVNNYEYVAYLYGVSLEEYYKNVLGVSEDDFFQICYDEGLYDIKYYLIIGAIAYNEKFQVTESEYEEYIEKEELSVSNDDEKKRVKYQILEEKVKLYLESVLYE